jgi:hypothetical protein|tara:strand:+ start:10141 stop:10542 length:402 start_codon:yes stop_codon:yes gene_type:complete
MSRARELSKVGGTQQTIAGVSTHVGISTFAAATDYFGVVTIKPGGTTTAAFTSNVLTITGNILPDANGTRNIGANGTRFANIFSSDLDLSNQAKGGNSVDGTWGSYLIEEGEEHLYLTNRRSGKKYRFVLEEV